jgi:hypothetical protein
MVIPFYGQSDGTATSAIPLSFLAGNIHAGKVNVANKEVIPLTRMLRLGRLWPLSIGRAKRMKSIDRNEHVSAMSLTTPG